MIKKIDHIVITTGDICACVAFYEELGFTAYQNGERWELFVGDFKINVHLKGRELEPKAQNVKIGSADLCFEITESIEEWMLRLKRAGITILLGVVTCYGVGGEMRSIYLNDPDGNLIELCSYE